MPQISTLSGRAGATYSILPPQSGPRQEFAHGPFAAELAPALPVRSSRNYPDQLTVGLLVRSPDADGTGGVELHYPGYARQRVDLSPRNDTHFAIGRPILFEIFGCPPVSELALFDGDGNVVAHGVIQGRSTTTGRPSRFEFRSHQVLVRKP